MRFPRSNCTYAIKKAAIDMPTAAEAILLEVNAACVWVSEVLDIVGGRRA
jgi:hypothetical protein